MKKIFLALIFCLAFFQTSADFISDLPADRHEARQLLMKYKANHEVAYQSFKATRSNSHELETIKEAVGHLIDELKKAENQAQTLKPSFTLWYSRSTQFTKYQLFTYITHLHKTVLAVGDIIPKKERDDLSGLLQLMDKYLEVHIMKLILALHRDSVELALAQIDLIEHKSVTFILLELVNRNLKNWQNIMLEAKNDPTFPDIDRDGLAFAAKLTAEKTKHFKMTRSSKALLDMAKINAQVLAILANDA